uniref:hypothetical protein n=1 Tax=Labilibaculum sp. TaxID=2060723 RepID=UPI00356412F4
MNYQNLIDFSIHPSDLNRFSNQWEGLKDFIAEKKIEGIELLIGYDTPSGNIPMELVKSVHLPFWVTWLEVW